MFCVFNNVLVCCYEYVRCMNSVGAIHTEGSFEEPNPNTQVAVKRGLFRALEHQP